MKSLWESWICENNNLPPNEAKEPPYTMLKSGKLKKVDCEHNLFVQKGNTLVSSSLQMETLVGAFSG